MQPQPDAPIRLAIVLTPHCNAAATMAFVDPFRAANYLDGARHYAWRFVSEAGGPCPCSNGTRIGTEALARAAGPVDFAVVSSSWTPERHATPSVVAALRGWARAGATLVGIDTGAFILAQCGLLAGRAATVHYEHIDALAELYPDIEVRETLMVFDGARITGCGGMAAADMALGIVQGTRGSALANAAARYILHGTVRGPAAPQIPERAEPLGARVPEPVRTAIRLMEAHLEDPLPIPDISARVGISQRQLGRLFAAHVKKSPALYYRDIRLDRARGLVTQTDMAMLEIAVASGFASPVHFSRAYRARFGLPPIRDRVEGRIPFEFRAWPMHRPKA